MEVNVMGYRVEITDLDRHETYVSAVTTVDIPNVLARFGLACSVLAGLESADLVDDPLTGYDAAASDLAEALLYADADIASVHAQDVVGYRVGAAD